jgi:hypothetical protein
MVDIRPLLFINALMLMLLVSAGFVRLGNSLAPEQSEQTVQTESNTATAEKNQTATEAVSAPEPESDVKAVESDPIFKDQMPPNKDEKILASIKDLNMPPNGEPIIISQQQQASTNAIQTGKVTIRSNVYDDIVLINGKPYGPSKLEVALSPGTYDVEVTKAGFSPWRQTVQVTRGADIDVNARLERYTTVNYKNGTWENDIQTGEGRYQDGAKIDYQGSFVNGLFHGNGSARYADGSKYQGQWFEGDRKGEGTFTSSNGDTYVGQFSDNEFNGDGTQTRANGDIYTGYWINGALNGQGSLTTRDGLLYVGGFSDNLFHGSGSLTYPDGGHYEGSFSNGLFHGKGVEVYPNGKRYDGQFIEGLYHGKGELMNPNGSKITGTFKDGEPFGKVTLTTAEGEVFTARSSEPGVCYRPKSYRATECPELDGW